MKSNLILRPRWRLLSKLRTDAIIYKLNEKFKEASESMSYLVTIDYYNGKRRSIVASGFAHVADIVKQLDGTPLIGLDAAESISIKPLPNHFSLEDMCEVIESENADEVKRSAEEVLD